MTDRTQSEVTRRSERDSRIISVIGCGMAFAGVALVLWLQKLGWSHDAAVYAGLIAAAPVFAGMFYWVWRRNMSASNSARPD